MSAIRSDATIGSRFEEILQRVDKALTDPTLLTDSEEDFLNRLQERLSQFEERTFVSAGALNFLTRIESKLEGVRL